MFPKKLKLGVYLIIVIFLTLGLSISLQAVMAAVFEATTGGLKLNAFIYNDTGDSTVNDWMDIRYGIHNNGAEDSGRLRINDEAHIDGGLTVDGNITVAGQNVCRQNGTNCPATTAYADSAGSANTLRGVTSSGPHGAGYYHIGTWGGGYTSAGSILVNGAQYAEVAGTLSNMNISQFTNNSGYITSAGVGDFVPKNTWWGSTYTGSNGDIYLGFWSKWLSTDLSERATHRGEGTNYIDYSRYVYDNGAYQSAGWKEPSSLGVYYAYLGRLVYNNGAYSGSGWVEPSDLGVRYAASAGSANTLRGVTSSGPHGAGYYHIGTWGGGYTSAGSILVNGAQYAEVAGTLSNMNISQFTNNSGYLASGGSPTFTEVYANGWFRNNANNTGLYNQANGNHWYSDGTYWKAGNNNSGAGGIQLRYGHEGSLKGYLYWDGGGFGLLSSDGNWRVRTQPGYQELYGTTYGDSSQFNIYYDRQNTGYYVVPRSTSRMNEIQADRVYGFTDIRSPIFYDYNNTGYYLDPNGNSQVSSIYANGWFRAQGQTGLYFQDYGGGWYMTDTSWIRAYNNKGVYTPGEMQAGTVRANSSLCIAGDCKTAWSQVGGGTAERIVQKVTRLGTWPGYNCATAGGDTADGNPCSQDLYKCTRTDAINNRTVTDVFGYNGWDASTRIECSMQYTTDSSNSIQIEINEPNNAYWECTDYNLQDYCGDEDGCRVTYYGQHKTASDDQVRGISMFMNMETPAWSKNNGVGVYGHVQVHSGETNWITGNGSANNIFNGWEWTYIMNYYWANCGGNNTAFSNPYVFRFVTHPAIRSKYIIYDKAD